MRGSGLELAVGPLIASLYPFSLCTVVDYKSYSPFGLRFFLLFPVSLLLPRDYCLFLPENARAPSLRRRPFLQHFLPALNGYPFWSPPPPSYRSFLLPYMSSRNWFIGLRFFPPQSSTFFPSCFFPPLLAMELWLPSVLTRPAPLSNFFLFCL